MKLRLTLSLAFILISCIGAVRQNPPPGVPQVTVPQAAPTITNNPQTTWTTTTSSGTVTVTTDQLTTAVLKRGSPTGPPYGVTCETDSALSTSHTLTCSSLSAGTLYETQITVTNVSTVSTNSAELSFTTNSAGCGTPGFACGYTATDVKVEVTLDGVGTRDDCVTGFCPAVGEIFNDTSFTSTQIVRATNAATFPLSSGQGIMPASTDTQIAAIDDTAFIVMGEFGSGNQCQIVRTFNSSTMAVGNHTGSGNGQCIGSGVTNAGWEITGSGRFITSVPASFSFVNADVIYGWSFSDARQLRKALRSTQVFSDVYSVAASDGVPNAIAAGFNPITFSRDAKKFVWVGNVSGDSPTGQNNWTIVAVCYNPHVELTKSGCRYYNVLTGAVSNGTGSTWATDSTPTGTISSSARYKVHRAVFSQDGNYVLIVQNNCTVSCTNFNGTVWEVGTTTALDMLSNPNAMRAGGHNQIGYSKMANFPNNSDRTEFYIRPNNDLTTKSLRIAQPSPTSFSFNSYGSYGLTPTDDTGYMLFTLYRTNNACSSLVYDNEALLVNVDTAGAQRVVRVVKLGRSAPDGGSAYVYPKVIMWPSQNFGQWTTNYSCNGGNLRGSAKNEVFIFRLTNQ